jgi:hypothetical protein
MVRLDEINGEVTVGRKLAHQGHWVKVGKNKEVIPFAQPVVENRVQFQQAATEEVLPEIKAAITEEMNLDIVEIFNAKKYPKPLKAGEFNGSLSASNGTLDSLSVNLPNGESIQISSAEMNGNVFEYDQDGMVYSGMIYEITKGSYMVTLTNGPYEGTRMKFQSAISQEVENQEASEINPENIANVDNGQNNSEFQPVMNDDGTQMEVGQFGNPGPAGDQQMAQPEQPIQEQAESVAEVQTVEEQPNYDQQTDVQPIDPQENETQIQVVPENENYGFNFEQQNQPTNS